MNSSSTKNSNGWASLVTGSKEKKPTTEPSSSSSILNDSTSGTTASSPKSSINSLNKTSFNGGNLNLLKTTSSTVLSTIKPPKSSSPPVVKPQIKSPTTKILPQNKSIQRVGSPTPLGRQTSTTKSPPSSSTGAPPASRSSTTNSNQLKIPSGLDCEKRLKKIRKLAAEKTLTKKF